MEERVFGGGRGEMEQVGGMMGVVMGGRSGWGVGGQGSANGVIRPYKFAFILRWPLGFSLLPHLFLWAGISLNNLFFPYLNTGMPGEARVLDMVRVLLLDGASQGFLGVFLHCIASPYLSSICAIYPVSSFLLCIVEVQGVWCCVYICLLSTRSIAFEELDTRRSQETHPENTRSISQGAPFGVKWKRYVRHLPSLPLISAKSAVFLTNFSYCSKIEVGATNQHFNRGSVQVDEYQRQYQCIIYLRRRSFLFPDPLSLLPLSSLFPFFSTLHFPPSPFFHSPALPLFPP